MSTRDYNGHRIKPGHDGSVLGHPTGPYRPVYVWLVCRHDDKLYGYWESYQGAALAFGLYRRLNVPAKRDWFDPVRVPVQSVRQNDVIELNDLNL